MNKEKNRKHLLKLTLIMLSLTVLFVVSTDQSSAATINVGSGAGNQSATIQGGITAASPNDKVIVHNKTGNYNEFITISKNGLNVTAGTGETVNVITTSTTKPIFTISGTSSTPVQFVTLNGFTIVGNPNNFISGLKLSYANDCTISNNIFKTNRIAGVELFASNNNNIYNNQISGSSYGIYQNGNPGSSGNKYLNNHITNCQNGIGVTSESNTTISNNNINIPDPTYEGFSTTGITLTPGTTANQINTINNNTITKTITNTADTTGIKITDTFSPSNYAVTNEIYSNDLTNSLNGIYVLTPYANNWNNKIYLNRIYNNSYGLLSTITTLSTINAINNWWGKNTTPTTYTGDSPATTYDIWRLNTNGNLYYNPWIVLNVNASPSTINTGQTSTITADLTKNSNNEDTTTLYPGKYIPNGITANFSSDSLGTVNPTTNTTTNGKANTTFTGNTSGVSTVSATVDAATVNTGVTVQNDINPPVVSNVDPADAAINVPVNQVITVTFNKDIQAGLFGPYNSISLFDGTKYISLIKNIAGNILTLTPAENLIPGTTYTINIPYFAIADLTGNLLQSTYTSTFTTIPNIINPVINTIDPVNAAINVPVNQVITVTFNKDIQAGLFGPYNSISLFDGTKYISLIKNIAGNILTLTPAENLIPGTTYTINIPYFAIADLTGNLLQSTYTSTFTTIPNIINPVINTIDPVNAAINVPVNQVITVTFNKDIQAGLFGPYNSISLFDGTKYISLIKNIAGNILTLTPAENLIPGTTYTINIPYFAIADLTGNLLQSTYTSTFTTA